MYTPMHDLHDVFLFMLSNLYISTLHRYKNNYSVLDIFD